MEWVSCMVKKYERRGICYGILIKTVAAVLLLLQTLVFLGASAILIISADKRNEVIVSIHDVLTGPAFFARYFISIALIYLIIFLFEKRDFPHINQIAFGGMSIFYTLTAILLLSLNAGMKIPRVLPEKREAYLVFVALAAPLTIMLSFFGWANVIGVLRSQYTGCGSGGRFHRWKGCVCTRCGHTNHVYYKSDGSVCDKCGERREYDSKNCDFYGYAEDDLPTNEIDKKDSDQL